MSPTSPVKVAVTGAAGQIGYALLFRIASGQLLGAGQQVSLRLLEVEPVMPALDGVAMELFDCAFPLLADVTITSDPRVAFDGASWALLVGSAPRRAGMERRDLLGINGRIFQQQARAIEGGAASDVRVLVVGNPCNTNCLIARSNALDVPGDRWFSMMRLDHNRARQQLASAAGAGVEDVTRLAVWGNHSSTQFPDYAHALIAGRPATELIDRSWLQGPFLDTIQGRGAAIIKARGASSAGSAANAIIDSVVSIRTPTAAGDWMSLGVPSQGQYGVPEGLVFGFPASSDGSSVSVVEGISHDPFAASWVRKSIEDLAAERDEVSELLR